LKKLEKENRLRSERERERERPLKACSCLSNGPIKRDEIEEEYYGKIIITR
jgi:hypothetical protein